VAAGRDAMTAEIDDIIGRWDYRTLPDNIRIGVDCFLERRESFGRFRSRQSPGLLLGSGVRVLTWTTFNVEPSGCVIVGDNTVLVGAVFMCVGSIRIGAHCVVSYNVTISDCDFHPIELEARRRDAIAVAPSGDRAQRPLLSVKPVEIGNDVLIGTGAIILKGVRVGDGATIAPGTVLTRDVPPGACAAGNPAQISGCRA
jgi:acetyltransferase-like isoleucine patch superfamily enzyme